MAAVGGPTSSQISSHDPGPKSKPVPASARRPTRSGRLGIDKQGEYTYKNTPSSTLMAAVQLGLHNSIGSIEPKPRRDILMTDFEVVETVDFPASGSEVTPAHKYKDFTFKTYSPVAFRFFREAFGIEAGDYLVAMCDHPLRECSNPGASGSLFYISADDAFIIKTVQKKEAHFLQKLLPGYYLNLTQNKKTLLPKFFGLYRYKCGTVNIRIVVMNNLLPSTLKYHEKYDLKGSTFKRKAVGEELSKSSPTFKDLDYVERHDDAGISLLPDKYDILLRTLQRDCSVLESFGIMDYSLLLGIHNIDQAHRDGEAPPTRDSPIARTDDDRLHPLVQSRIELSKNFSIISVENIPLAIEGAQEGDPSAHYPEGHILGKVKGDRVLVYLGIIDILQSYRLKKKLEHTMKSMITDGNTVSVHNPSFYARRFQDFLEKRVFLREKVKPRSRKVAKAQPGVRRPPGIVRAHTLPHGGDGHRRYSDRQQYSPREGSSPRRITGGVTSPTHGPSSSPPLTSPLSTSNPVSGLTQSLQAAKYVKVVSDTVASEQDSHLPELPLIEVHKTGDGGASSERREKGKEGESAGKGVRFADYVESHDGDRAKEREEEEVKEMDGDRVDSDRGRGRKEEEAREMDSVDFDEVKGTSTPINEDSPSLPKHNTSTEVGQTFSDSTYLESGGPQEGRQRIGSAPQEIAHQSPDTPGTEDQS